VNHSVWSSALLTLRSLLWTALLPGFLAGYVPWEFFGVSRLRLNLASPQHLIGLFCIGAGILLLGSCIWEFARRGRGTLAPVDPPRKLVVRGLYRYVRNPMYLSVTMIVLGEALLVGSMALIVYWAVWFLAANLFVIGYEEPALRRRFGEPYELYARQVNRWLPTWKSRN
jgi:protein-S-isoprenylcysteine O-methyltransferase Ste14